MVRLPGVKRYEVQLLLQSESHTKIKTGLSKHFLFRQPGYPISSIRGMNRYRSIQFSILKFSKDPWLCAPRLLAVCLCRLIKRTPSVPYII